MRIGLYFGSFNPIHNGHCIIAQHLAENTPLQEVWLVVSPHNPLKQSTTLLNEYHRLHLVQTALQQNPVLKASTVEFNLPKPSYTIDTLTYLTEKYPQHQFAVIMGSDSWLNIEHWKNHTQLLRNYPIYIYNRPNFPVKLPLPPGVSCVNAPLLDISATYIRQQIKQGHSIRYLVPEEVANEIEKNNYYK